jgi:hypothetical protein
MYFFCPTDGEKNRTKKPRRYVFYFFINIMASASAPSVSGGPSPWTGRFATTTERDIDRQFAVQPPVTPLTNWLPTVSQDPITALASLSSCYINLERGCDFHADERSKRYLKAWENPAPRWCGQNRRWIQASAPEAPIPLDRFGIPAAAYRPHR